VRFFLDHPVYHRAVKTGTEVAHVTRDSGTTFKVKRPKVKVTGGVGILCRPRSAQLVMSEFSKKNCPTLLLKKYRLRAGAFQAVKPVLRTRQTIRSVHICRHVFVSDKCLPICRSHFVGRQSRPALTVSSGAEWHRLDGSVQHCSGPTPVSQC